MLNTIWQQKHRRLGHVCRSEVLLREIVEGRMKGSGFCGGKRLHMFSDLASPAKCLAVKMAAEDQE